MTRSLAESLAGGSPELWSIDWLRAAGFPTTAANIQVVYSWEFAESAAGGGMWNPLNTTQGGFLGESDYNSVGVKNYRQRADGIAACAKVIHNGLYPQVVAAFASGVSAPAVVRAIVTSPWGTRQITLRPLPNGPMPSPAVTSKEQLMVIQTEPPKFTAGVVRTHVLSPDGMYVRSYGGGSIGNDQPVLGQVYRQWRPVGIPATTALIGIAPLRVANPAGAQGVLVTDANGLTHSGVFT